MLDVIIKNLVNGITLIEDEFGAINKILSKQIGAYAASSGKKVCYLESPEGESPNGGLGRYSDQGFEVPPEDIENTGVALKNTVVYRTDQRYLPLEELKFDLIVFDSFSSYVFGKSDKEVVDLMDEIVRLSNGGKSFVLTSEAGMLDDRINSYIRATADSVVIVRAEIQQYKVNRLLFIPKMKGTKPLDRVIKVTVEDEGIDIDTREFVG